MNKIKIQCPAKINLNLKVLNKRQDGFHNIESIMQTISLYDYLNISVEKCDTNIILLTGSSKDIPYDEKNLVYKAVKLFLEETKLSSKVEIFIEKNIPIAAGLAGGSTDAAGTIFGLNKLFHNILSYAKLHELCSKLGSDLNVCLKGGRILAKGRGEIIENLPFEYFKLSLIKPINLGISAKEAYTKFSAKPKNILKDKFLNDLEWAMIDDYDELLYIKNKYPDSMMTGSGSTYFIINNTFETENNYWISNNLESIESGVCEI